MSNFFKNFKSWHLILAAVVVTVFSLIYYYWLLAPVDEAAIDLLASLLHGILWAAMLQGVNESIQAINPDVARTYGSFKNFQRDSKRDWIDWFKGVAIGFTLAGFVIGVQMMI